MFFFNFDLPTTLTGSEEVYAFSRLTRGAELVRHCVLLFLLAIFSSFRLSAALGPRIGRRAGRGPTSGVRSP